MRGGRRHLDGPSRERGDSFAVLYLDEQSRWEEVLSLPHTPYRADDAESINHGSEQSKIEMKAGVRPHKEHFFAALAYLFNPWRMEAVTVG